MLRLLFWTAKPCWIADTVCVQLGREVVVSILVRVCLPEGYPSYISSFKGPPEGLSVTSSGGLSDRLRSAVRGADEGIHSRGSEVVNPSCGNLHRRSSSTLLPAALRVGNDQIKTLYASP